MGVRYHLLRSKRCLMFRLKVLCQLPDGKFWPTTAGFPLGQACTATTTGKIIGQQYKHKIAAGWQKHQPNAGRRFFWQPQSQKHACALCWLFSCSKPQQYTPTPSLCDLHTASSQSADTSTWGLPRFGSSRSVCTSRPSCSPRE